MAYEATPIAVCLALDFGLYSYLKGDSMDHLLQMKCVACRADSPRVTAEEIAEFRPQVPDWQLLERDGIPRLERAYKFKNFAEALAFTIQLGELAEAEGHHPAILTEWGKVTVTWWTHKIKGLHRNDFILAARTDQLVASAASGRAV